MTLDMRATAGAVIFRFNKQKLEVLLVHQSDKRKNIWSIPKGGVEDDEEFEKAARREVHEETNVALDRLEFLGYVDYGKANKRLYCYMGNCPSEATLACNVPEIDKAGFFEVARAKKMVDKRQRGLINALQKILAFENKKATA